MNEAEVILLFEADVIQSNVCSKMHLITPIVSITCIENEHCSEHSSIQPT